MYVAESAKVFLAEASTTCVSFLSLVGTMDVKLCLLTNQIMFNTLLAAVATVTVTVEHSQQNIYHLNDTTRLATLNLKLNLTISQTKT